ncbi:MULTISPECIES: Flp family type IVb pilin [Brevundimonas]|jgi:pilus assembly protein Flp/PilA|uniref:Flp family type IVb pilin n=1 Tax=Brevundimonas TaxID=41275 RepID=UPI000E0C2DB6|nr:MULTISPECIES: Flp family type IVb pilin [Brevundimonas]NWE54208.1 Flp family type IVb pilin [Brevundimonas sp. P7753]WQE36307.1 Flp family type IVb pilin [Brevundimonas bullata]
MRRFIGQLHRDDSGATAIEYGLICGLICLVIIGAMGAFGAESNAMYRKITDAIDGAING